MDSVEQGAIAPFLYLAPLRPPSGNHQTYLLGCSFVSHPVCADQQNLPYSRSFDYSSLLLDWAQDDFGIGAPLGAI